MATSAAELELLDAATASLGALARAVRGATLYDAGHAQVEPFLRSFVRGVAHCCSLREPLVLLVTEGRVELDGVDLTSASSLPVPLLQRLWQDGVRQLHFRGAFELAAAVELTTALAPYVTAHQAPVESVADRLHWAPTPGLNCVIHRQGGFVVDPMTRAQQTWREAVARPQLVPDPRFEETFEEMWDGLGGAIPWPPPVREDLFRRMKEELAEADQIGVPTLRLGLVLSDIAEHWPEDPRLLEMLEFLAAQIDGLLADDLPEEASRLLRPLARWTERSGDGDPDREALRRHLQGFLTLAGERERLVHLREGIARAALTPDQVVAWFAVLPAPELVHILRFASTLPHGPHRLGLVGLVSRMAQRSPRSLAKAAATAEPATAEVALAVVEISEDPDLRVDVLRAVLQRTEPPLLARAAQLVGELDHPSLHGPMARLLWHRSSDLRLLALRYSWRFRVTSAAARVEELATGAGLWQVSRPERVLIGLAFGATGGLRATQVARRALGDEWRYGDPERAVPWVLALAAGGADDADEPLQWLEELRLPGLNGPLTDARNAWQMARFQRERR